jgi:hypothetical protein
MAGYPANIVNGHAYQVNPQISIVQSAAAIGGQRIGNWDAHQASLGSALAKQTNVLNQQFLC